MPVDDLDIYNRVSKLAIQSDINDINNIDPVTIINLSNQECASVAANKKLNDKQTNASPFVSFLE